MKKMVLFLVLALNAGNFLTSCSNRDEDPTVQPEKQDFTNANYIKSTMQGTWVQLQYSYDGETYQANNWNNKYVFSADNYTFTPYNGEYPSLNDSGPYTITPVVGNANAILKLTKKNNYIHNLTLLDYSGGIVTTSEPDVTSPTGKLYFKYKKQ